MKYYKLLYDYENESDTIFGKVYDSKSIERYDVEKGISLQVQDEEMVIELDEEEGLRETDYFATDYSWLILSEKTKRILESIQKDELQFIKIRIVSKSNIILNESYYLLVILCTEDALDLKNSIYDEFELDEGEKVLSIEKYALLENKINNHIFRLKDETMPVFVSEVIKKEFVKNKLSGFDFLQVKVN